MTDEHEAIDKIIASWGTDEANELLAEVLNDHYWCDESLNDLCDGGSDNVTFLEVVATEETDGEFKATVEIEFDKITTPGCKDANNREHGTGHVDVSISKAHELIEISVAAVQEPDLDYY